MLSLFAITLRCNINNSVDYQKCCSFGISFCGCREICNHKRLQESDRVWLLLQSKKSETKCWDTIRSERSLSVFETPPLFITLPHSLFCSLSFLKWKLASHHLCLALLLVSPFCSQQGQKEVFPTYSHCVLCFSRKNSCSGFGLLNICFLIMRLFLICCKVKQIDFFKVEGNLFIFTACAFNYIPWAPLTICVYGNYKQSCSSAKLRKFSELYAELLS